MKCCKKTFRMLLDGTVIICSRNWCHGQRAVENLLGVNCVTNSIRIKSDADEAVEKEDIENALRRSWSIDDDVIVVKVTGHRVILTGTVDSWYQKEEAADLHLRRLVFGPWIMN